MADGRGRLSMVCKREMAGAYTEGSVHVTSPCIPTCN